jgi:hypothetical protein
VAGWAGERHFIFMAGLSGASVAGKGQSAQGSTPARGEAAAGAECTRDEPRHHQAAAMGIRLTDADAWMGGPGGPL